MARPRDFDGAALSIYYAFAPARFALADDTYHGTAIGRLAEPYLGPHGAFEFGSDRRSALFRGQAQHAFGKHPRTLNVAVALGVHEAIGRHG
jgi:hypothetical protein